MAKQQSPQQPWKPFKTVVRDLLIEHDITTGVGGPNLTAFAELLETTHYETLRKAVTGERNPTPKLMEEVAAAFGLDPAETFVEYRVWAAQRMFDPREVGVDTALANLEAWAATQKRQQRKR